MGKTKEKTEEKDEFVEVRYTGGTPYVIDYKSGGLKHIESGDIEKFNIRNREQLHVLMQILKQINTPRVNTVQYMDKQDMVHPVKYRIRFEVISGFEYLPKVIQKIKFNPNKYPSEEERKAVLSLVPNFYDKEEILYKIKK